MIIADLGLHNDPTFEHAIRPHRYHLVANIVQRRVQTFFQDILSQEHIKHIPSLNLNFLGPGANFFQHLGKNFILDAVNVVAENVFCICK